MRRRVVSADDVLAAARAGQAEVVVRPGDRVTPLARDVAHDKAVRIVVADTGPSIRDTSLAAPAAWGRSARDPSRDAGTDWVAGSPSGSPVEADTAPSSPGRLRHVPGVATMPLDPFPFAGPAPAMDVRTTDVVTSRDGMPMAAGVMSLREGAFGWTLTYDEVEYVLEGELHLTCGEQRVVGRPGDVIAIPKGSSITFGTPSWAKFLYVTYPADWGAS